jgi:hypothetical protein
VHIQPLTICVLWALPWNLRPPRLCSNKILDASVSIAAPRPPLPTEEHMKTCQGFSPSLDLTRLLTWAVSTLVFLGVGHNKFRKLRHKTKPRSHQELHTTRSLPLQFSRRLKLRTFSDHMLIRFIARTTQVARRITQISTHLTPPQRAKMATLGAYSKKHKVTVVGSGNWYDFHLALCAMLTG